MVYLLWRLGKPPCTVHIFIPTILLLALFRKEERAFFAQKQELRFFSAQSMLGTRVANQYALFGRHLFCTDCLVHTNRAGGSPLTGGGFFAEPQRGVRRLRRRERAAYGGGNVPRPAAGECADAARAHKRVDTCGFHPLVNLPFPLEGLAQITNM